MSSGLNNTNGGNTRGTLQPTSVGRIYIQYKDSVARAWETQSVASHAIENGKATKVSHDQPEPPR